MGNGCEGNEDQERSELVFPCIQSVSVQAVTLPSSGQYQTGSFKGFNMPQYLQCFHSLVSSNSHKVNLPLDQTNKF
jgi:hypothetical protein